MPKQKKSPQEKKRDFYDTDRYTVSEYPHSFRKTWPKKKAKAQRACRRKVKQLLERESNEQELIASTRRRRVRKWGTITNREKTLIGQEKRLSFIGRNYFKSRYSSKLHRKKFKCFLMTLMRGQSQYSKKVRDTFRTAWHSSTPINKWLKSFFVDEPEMQILFEDWMTKVDIGVQKE